jgi:hypothetical protein
MRKRQLLWLCLLTLVGLSSAYVVLWLIPDEPDSITLSNFARITSGMSEQEVVTLLGGPAAEVYLCFGGTLARQGQPSFRKDWRGREGTIFVMFDGNNRVVWGGFWPAEGPPPRPTFTQRLRARLGW